jgi:RNA polymerase sigma-70 factor (ECF subfamily)
MNGRAASEPSDEALARQVQQGGRAALEQLVARYQRPLHAVAASYLRDQADIDDAVQETFLRVIKAIGRYDASRAFAPWLYQIARNVARDRAVMRSRNDADELTDALHATDAQPDVLAERAQLRSMMKRAIDALPEQRRTAFRMHDVDGYTTAEIAHMMGLSEGTVRSHVHHARRALRNVLSAQLPSEERS